jgi:hypothetical protein
MCDGDNTHTHREQTNTQAQTKTSKTTEPKFVVEVEETAPECVETPATR